jgi:hypothetical protein
MMTNRQTLAKIVVTQKTHLQLCLISSAFFSMMLARTVPETEMYPATMGPNAGPIHQSYRPQGQGWASSE